MNLTFKVKTDFHNKSLVMIHFLFPEKIQLKTNIEKRKTFYIDVNQRCCKLMFLLVTPFSSCGKIFEQILVE